MHTMKQSLCRLWGDMPFWLCISLIILIGLIIISIGMIVLKVSKENTRTDLSWQIINYYRYEDNSIHTDIQCNTNSSFNKRYKNKYIVVDSLKIYTNYTK